MRNYCDTGRSYDCCYGEFIQKDAPEISMDDIYDSDVSFMGDRKSCTRFNKHDPIFDQDAFDRTAEKIISRMKSKKSSAGAPSIHGSLTREPLFERPGPSVRPIPQLSPSKRLFAKPTMNPLNASQIPTRSLESKKLQEVEKMQLE